MAEDIWRDDSGGNELDDAANIFEELEKTPQREDLGDILYVDGIEDDESVVEEDVNTEETTTTPAHSKETEMPVSPPAKQSPFRKKPLPTEQTIAQMFSDTSTQTNEEEMTIGEFFLPLVRQSPPSKIRVENDTIGSFFEKYIGQDET